MGKCVALHAFNLEEYGLAMTYVKKLQDKSISEYLDLEIMILIKTGKLEEAVAKFRGVLSLRPNGTILYPTVKDLIVAVNALEDGETLQKDVMTILQLLIAKINGQ